MADPRSHGPPRITFETVIEVPVTVVGHVHDGEGVVDRVLIASVVTVDITPLLPKGQLLALGDDVLGEER
jgi:hypothetical protein